MYLYNYLVGFNTAEAAEKLSTDVFNLAIPPGARSLGEVTTSMYSVLKHPHRNEWALIIPDKDTFPRHISYAHQFNYEALIDRLVSTYGILAAEVQPIAQYIVNNDQVEVYDIIPASWKSRYLKQEQAQAAGWLDDSD